MSKIFVIISATLKFILKFTTFDAICFVNLAIVQLGMGRRDNFARTMIVEIENIHIYEFMLQKRVFLLRGEKLVHFSGTRCDSKHPSTLFLQTWSKFRKFATCLYARQSCIFKVLVENGKPIADVSFERFEFFTYQIEFIRTKTLM